MTRSRTNGIKSRYGADGKTNRFRKVGARHAPDPFSLPSEQFPVLLIHYQSAIMREIRTAICALVMSLDTP